MTYVKHINEGPLDGALVVVDTDLEIVAHCFVYLQPDGAVTATMTRETRVPRAAFAAALRGLADQIDADPRPDPLP